MFNINKIAQAIMGFEGYFEGSVSFRNHNPGNLKYLKQPGTIGKDDLGFAVFDTFESGYRALYKLISGWYKGTNNDTYHPDMTIYEVFQRYSTTDSKPYAEYVAKQIGVAPTTKLRDIV